MGLYLRCCGKAVREKYQAYRLDNFKNFMSTFPVITECPKCHTPLVGFVGYDKPEGQTGIKHRTPEKGIEQVYKSEKTDWLQEIALRAIEIKMADLFPNKDKPTRGMPHVSEYTSRICRPAEAVYRIILYGDKRISNLPRTYARQLQQ